MQTLKKSEIAREEMGEVRTSVTLTNATDRDLVRRGKLSPSDVHSYTADALVDTGAVRTVLPFHVVEQLDLRLRGKRVVELADGRKETVLTGAVEIEIDGRNTIEDALVLGDEVIVGQTVLETLDLLVDCANRRLVPNPAHPDQPVIKIK
ncbi:MAG TPA: retroviral-like aspartic protease family protein [Blastocatellia bacterium]|nr:retroviral-like aspartic protease family protein [Blastocatellia bacterium]